VTQKETGTLGRQRLTTLQRRFPTWAAILLAAVSAVGAAPVAESPLDGQKIISIIVIRQNIFDTAAPGTSSWPYRAANALHTKTRERFIRSMLLFAEGEPFSAQLAAESARLLRSLGFLNPVKISARPATDGVEVTVETRDQWTLDVGASFDLFGNRSSWSVAFEESNFLGTGREVKVKYSEDSERTTWKYMFFDPNILGTRWRAWFEHRNASDGHLNRVRAEYPFFSLATPRAGGGAWFDERLIEYLYSAGEQQVSGTRESENFRIWGGQRLAGTSDEITRRLRVGWDHQRIAYDDWRWQDGRPFETPESRAVDGPRIEVETITERFVVVRGFRAWSVQEDVALGPNYSAGMTLSHPTLGGDEPRVLLDGRWNIARQHGRWMTLASAWTSGRIDDGEARNWIVGFQIAGAQIGRRGFQARLKVEASHELDRDLQLTLGAENGLRGWNPDTFDGTGRAVANVQWRFLIKENILHLASLGGMVFADAGHSWGARVGRSTERVRGDIGVGLLADLLRVSRVHLVRLEVALPDDGSGLVFTVSANALF